MYKLSSQIVRMHELQKAGALTYNPPPDPFQGQTYIRRGALGIQKSTWHLLCECTSVNSCYDNGSFRDRGWSNCDMLNEKRQQTQPLAREVKIKLLTLFHGKISSKFIYFFRFFLCKKLFKQHWVKRNTGNAFVYLN